MHTVQVFHHNTMFISLNLTTFSVLLVYCFCLFVFFLVQATFASMESYVLFHSCFNREESSNCRKARVLYPRANASWKNKKFFVYCISYFAYTV